MADILCGYTADRDETLTAYLYDDIEPAQRAAFDAHVATCERCRHELAELRGVRGRLKEWSAPDPRRPLDWDAPMPFAVPAARRGWSPLREIPAWAQVAAALLVLGVSAGIANLDVRYGALAIHTGWSRQAPAADAGNRPAAPTPVPAAQPVKSVAAPDTPWRTDLDALERRLRTEFRASPAAGSPLLARSDATASDALLLRKVRALVEESERRQSNELALQIAQVVREFDAKRGSDLASIRSMRTVQSATGAEVAWQKQYLDLLATRASLQK